ncbi:hypothetical protein [Myxococcus stipitatus]|uniref:hypothetical protein n=1 Tax=Myxococcus stipitatus TaxID=83455 RepID=UPI0030D0FCB0
MISESCIGGVARGGIDIPVVAAQQREVLVGNEALVVRVDEPPGGDHLFLLTDFVFQLDASVEVL